MNVTISIFSLSPFLLQQVSYVNLFIDPQYLRQWDERLSLSRPILAPTGLAYQPPHRPTISLKVGVMQTQDSSLFPSFSFARNILDAPAPHSSTQIPYLVNTIAFYYYYYYYSCFLLSPWKKPMPCQTMVYEPNIFEA